MKGIGKVYRELTTGGLPRFKVAEFISMGDYPPMQMRTFYFWTRWGCRRFMKEFDYESTTN